MAAAPPRFIVGQIGARMHYAVPRIFERLDWLARFHTDLLAPPPNSLPETALRLLGRHFGLARRILSRSPDGIPGAKVVTSPWLGVEYAARLHLRRTQKSRKEAFLWAGKQFTKQIVRAGFNNANAVYLFNSAALEALDAARNEGCFCVLEQTIAPMAVECRLVGTERKKWPGWESEDEPDEIVAAYATREEKEWRSAHLVLCGSEFVVDGIRICGGPVGCCSVVPYGFTPSFRGEPKKFGVNRTLNVLFLGTLGLRKGIQYLYTAALKLPPNRITVRAAGPITLSPVARRTLQNRLHLCGPVPRTEVQQLYRWADVVVLPSLCEGSATVCYEALAAGLPVITTPNAGSVIRHDLDGFIVPAGDADAIAEKLELLLDQPRRLAEMSRQAVLRADEFTEERYGQRLLAAIECAWGKWACAS
jgi:glycosyltransferase involved in cell wall biosynthesis